jgi:uncharacterized membrane protein YccC
MVLAGALFIGKRMSDIRVATGAMTTLVLLSFHQMGMSQGVIPARLLDTAIGSVIAGLGAWLILPNWQARHWPRLAAQTLRAQAGYLQAILEQYREGKQDHLVYRQARRQAHNAEAALSNAYAAMRKEPEGQRLNMTASARFLVLTHMLQNYLSALGAHRGELEAGALDESSRQMVERLAQGLERLAQRLEAGHRVSAARLEQQPAQALAEQPPVPEAGSATSGPVSLLQAQLDLASRLLPELEQAAQHWD